MIPTDVKRATDRAIKRAVRHASPAWKREAWRRINALARTQAPFIASDVTAPMKRGTHDTRALGGLMRRARCEGIIKATGRWVPSWRKRSHSRPEREWVGA